MARTPLKLDAFGLHFEIRPGFTLLVLVIVVVMVRAGFWQLGRAGQKVAMQQAFAAALHADPVTLNGDLPRPEDVRYRKALATGEYLPGRQFLLDNRVQLDERGVTRVGYEVLTPLRLTNGGVVLVNRGWVPAGRDRARLPDINVESGMRRIEGVVNLPGESFHLGEMDSDARWPRLIQFIDYNAMARRLQADVYPAVIMLAPGEADGYLRDWQPVVQGPRIHYSYAIQWFAMSLAVIILFFVFTIRRK